MTPDETIDAFLRSVGPDADPSATWSPHTVREDSGAEALPSFQTHMPGMLGASAALELGEVLGEGGMGVVYSARQAELDRHVAVKKLKNDAAAHAKRALTREARVMGRLDHPNIIPVHALGKDADQRPVMVMKRVDGVSWRELARAEDHPAWARISDRGSTPIERHLSIFIDVCRAVAHAHERDTLHLDLKPANVMIGEHGEVYVVDWGLAAPVGHTLEAIAGTPAYMAPEQTQPGATLTEQTDVYLLGGTLFEAITGQRPRQGQSLETMLQSARAADTELDWPPTAAPHLRRLVEQACSPEREARHPSVGALIEDVRAYLQHAGSMRIAAAALERAAEVEMLLGQTPPDAAAVTSTYSAARFGFEQALLAWPDNPQARAGLHTLLTHMVRWSCSLDEAATAAGMLSALEGLSGPQPALRAAVHDIESRQQQRLAAERDQDLRVNYHARMVWMGSFVLFGVVAALSTRLGWQVTHVNITLLSLAVALSSWSLTGLLWSRLTGNDVSRRIVLTINLTLTVPLINRLAALATPEPPAIPFILAVDLISISICAVFISIFTDPRLIPASLVGMLAAAIAVVRPDLAVYCITSGVIVMPLSMVLTLWLRRDAFNEPQ